MNTVTFLIVVFLLMLTIQILLCFKVKQLVLRLVPIILAVGSTIAFSVMFVVNSNVWDSLVWLSYTFCGVFSIAASIIGWFIWYVLKIIKCGGVTTNKRTEMKKLVVIVWSITLCIAIGGVMMHYAIVRNVFDEMYYTWDKPNLVLTRFTNVPSLAENSFVGKTYGGGSITNHLYLIYDGNFKETDENYLMDSTSVSFSVLTDDYNCISGSGTINYAKTDDDTRAETFSIRFVYDIKTKELTIKPVIISSKFLSEQEPEKYSNYTSYEDKETIEKFIALHNITKSEIDTYKSYILNDVLIGLWVEGNGRASKFTVENPGEFTIIDNSYINLGEDWQD